MADPKKRAELKNKIETAEKRQQKRQERSFGDYARDARDGATSFVKEHPLTTLAGALAVGVVIASVVPGPGRRLRKQATRRGAVLAGVLADLAVTYGSQALEGAGKAASAGQNRLGDLGETLADSARSLRREAGDLAGDAGKRASRGFRDLRSRMSH